jgi:hypothetical protein
MLASFLTDKLGIRGKPDLVAVAGRFGLEVREVNAETFEGALIRAPGRRGGIIALNSSIPEPGRKRFTIAHEIGHYLLPGHEQFGACLPEALERWGGGLLAPELDANEFASELILPTAYVRPMLAPGHPDFAKIRMTATEYNASLTATTRKFLQLTDHACAMVWSTAGVIRWYQRSEGFTVFVRMGPLDPRSMAADLFRGDRQGKLEFEAVSADVWLSPPGDELVERVLECSIFLKNYSSVLTLLWIEDLLPTYTESDELLEELDPSQFTLDRKIWPKK